MSFLNTFLPLILSIPLGLGIGSGGLFLIYLSDVLGLPRESAVYFNLIFFLSALLASAAGHLRARRISFSILATVLLFGVPGAFLGRWIAARLSPVFLRLLLGAFLLFSGVFSLLSLKKRKESVPSVTSSMTSGS